MDDIQRATNHDGGLRGKTKDEIVTEYSECFEGLGRIAEPYHIKIDKGVGPVVHPPRKIPETLRSKLKDQLEKMEQSGVISKVNEPTPWVNSIVINEKQSGKLRVCIDPRDLNKAVKREHYQLPTQHEITARLAGAKYFSHLDAKSGFWQIPLDTESSQLTTFNTPFGRFRFNVIPFGFVFAQEVFHRTIEFVEFANSYGFVHTTTSPRYPQAGGLHERTMQTVKSM